MTHKRYQWASPDCVQCGNTFKASRSDARYCSATCRKKAQRARRKRKKAIQFYFDLGPPSTTIFIRLINMWPRCLPMLLHFPERLCSDQIEELLILISLASNDQLATTLEPEEEAHIIERHQLI